MNEKVMGVLDRIAQTFAYGDPYDNAADLATIRAHIEQLERIAARRLDRCERMMQAGIGLQSQLAAAEARVRELKSALTWYGRHYPECDTRRDSALKDRPKCTCGLDAAIDSAMQENRDAS
jgi:hypothetical protein